MWNKKQVSTRFVRSYRSDVYYVHNVSLCACTRKMDRKPELAVDTTGGRFTISGLVEWIFGQSVQGVALVHDLDPWSKEYLLPAMVHRPRTLKPQTANHSRIVK